ncbi:restriction endonuclease subunit S [Empedobacter falsenii]|uniref:restriction endonuclease subunit S n=1 Tax=Empedobacter falsenii TaxID=343874 RepID=UPI003A802C77
MSVKFEDFTLVVKDITGGNKKYGSTEYLSEGKYPIIDQGEKFIGGYINDEEVVKRDKDIVIFGDHTKVLKYVDFDFCLGADGVKVLQPNDKLTSKFLYYFLHTIELPNVGYSRHFKFLKETKIPLPPLATQKAISEKLDKADALRKKDQELLKQYDELAQSIFIEMFGDPVQNEKGWEVEKLGNICSFENGDRSSNYPSGDDLIEEGIPFLSTSNFSDGYLNFDRVNFISLDKFNSLRKGKAKYGDLIITLRGTLGQVIIYDNLNYESAFINAQMMIIRGVEISNKVLYYFFKSDSVINFIKSQNTGSAVPQITSDFLNKMSIQLYPLDLQNQFAEKIKNIEAQKELVKKQAEESENLFQALLQESFSFT